MTLAVESFTWDSGTTQAYLHCAIDVCDSTSSTCTPTCSRRKKRDTPFNPLDHVSIESVGPINMVVPTSCDDNHCSDHCADKFEYNRMLRRMELVPKCACLDGYEWKNDNAKYNCELIDELVPKEIKASSDKTPSTYLQWKQSQKKNRWYFGGASTWMNRG